jgi:hypothetical protein
LIESDTSVVLELEETTVDLLRRDPSRLP